MCHGRLWTVTLSCINKEWLCFCWARWRQNTREEVCLGGLEATEAQVRAQLSQCQHHLSHAALCVASEIVLKPPRNSCQLFSALQWCLVGESDGFSAQLMRNKSLGKGQENRADQWVSNLKVDYVVIEWRRKILQYSGVCRKIALSLVFALFVLVLVQKKKLFVVQWLSYLKFSKCDFICFVCMIR